MRSRRSGRARLVAAVLAIAALVPVTGDAHCIVRNDETNDCFSDEDKQFFITAQGYLQPEMEIERGFRIYIQNLDTVYHSVTYESPRCRGSFGNDCTDRFDFVMRNGQFLATGGKFITNGIPEGVYPFYCKFHSPAPGVGMVGVFRVT